jgi:hypothetical protein
MSPQQRRVLVAVGILVLALGVHVSMSTAGKVPADSAGAAPGVGDEGGRPASNGTVPSTPSTAREAVPVLAEPGAESEIELNPTAEPSTVLRVRVVDLAGSGLPGVEVRAAIPGNWGTWSDLRTATTDARGAVEFVGFAPGPIWAEVDANTLTPGRLAPPRETGAIKRDAPLELVLACPGAGVVEGRALHTDGRPLDSAHIRARSVDARWPSRFVRADDAGRYRLEAVPEGRWLLQVEAHDSRRFAGVALAPPTECAVEAGALTRVDLGVAEAGEWLIGRVFDGHARGVAGVLVRAGPPAVIRGEEVCSIGREVAFALTDESGAYRLGPLGAGRCVVQVGERHGSDGVTRDAVMFTQWPEPFFAEPGTGVEHITEVELAPDVVRWRVVPRMRGEDSGPSLRELTAKIGWCRLHLDTTGAWCFLISRERESFTLTVEQGQLSWRIELSTPPGETTVERTVDLPPR